MHLSSNSCGGTCSPTQNDLRQGVAECISWDNIASIGARPSVVRFQELSRRNQSSEDPRFAYQIAEQVPAAIAIHPEEKT